MKKHPATLLLLIVCCAAITPAFASKIFLKDGSQIEGTIVDTKDNKVSVQTQYGLLQFDKDFVEHVSTPAPSEVAYTAPVNASGISSMYNQGFRFSVDLYGKGDAYKTIKNTFDSNVRTLSSMFGHAEGSFDIASAGVGLTAGFVFTAKTDGGIEHGPQIQLLSAPDVKIKLRVTDASQSTVYADETDTLRTTMWRLTWQVGTPVKLSDTIYFMPRADVGALFGRMDFDNESEKQTWSGMTFSVSPSLLIGKPRDQRGAHFEVGASYTYIPEKEANTDFDTFEWNAIGFHAGALWMF